ncbi:glucosamine-6-phosphate deaminase [Paraliobacillus sp. JSM ZJ581]|uniref:glucosamine-6-phosphate deaminase n=1 Tax=Paraliobacillus sp. JSM ZJ581 TaxID=3342118 RepID=UPI0035A890B1
MRLIIAKDEKEMSNIAAQHLLGYMYQDRRVNMAITAGSSPVGTYNTLIPQVKNKLYFSNVHYYNFDEVPYRQEDREGVTISKLRELYLTPANISRENIHVLDQYNYSKYDEIIKKDGGLDVVLLGVGSDGHYCGNLPGTTKFGDMTSKVTIKEKSKKHILPEFDYIESHLPDYYLTMGPKSIMAIQNLIMIATGKEKSDIIKRLLDGPVDEEIPASILMLHPNLTLIIDADAASKL